MTMFCYQCEQSYRGTGCDEKGVCGKEPEVAVAQDILLYQIKGISYYANLARKKGITNIEINRFTLKALFVTVTNVNFDLEAILEYIKESEVVKQNAKKLCGENHDSSVPKCASFKPSLDKSLLLKQGLEFTVLNDNKNPDIRSLEHLLIYGVKGLAAYAHHASVLGYEDERIFDFIHEALSLITNENITVDELLSLNLKCGEINLICMELLDKAHTETFGHPEPTVVSRAIKKGPAIIVSGHDLKDLKEILEQTEGKGINVYTHGEMLPAHGYPGLKKYKHLVGHYGTAWQNQHKEFDGIPAAVYFTTNCIQEPKLSYMDRVFTGGAVGWSGTKHISGKDFSSVINKAIELGGFEEDIPGDSFTVGFGRDAVLNVADKVIDAVKSGNIKHFFLVGVCDGARPGRSYYSDFTHLAPSDTVILTLGCGKYRFNNHDFGSIGGIPRLLDIGQCNDAYSAVKIAQALAGAFKCGVNDLPLSLIISWYEQKAVAVLLTLLYLGIKGIRLGPSLPAFITPNVLNVLVDKFDLRPIKTAEEDLKEILAV